MEKQAIAVLPAQGVLEQLHSSLEGLSSSEAEKRHATYGFNVLKKNKNTPLDILGRQVKSSLIYLLAFASAFSFFLGDLSDGIIIAVILLGLTDFLGGAKLGREHPKRGHHAKGATNLYEGIQTGSGAISAQEWEVPNASGP